MPRNRVNRNPKPTREQLLKVVKLQQQQVGLLFQHLEVLYKKIDDQERDIMSVLKVLEQKQNNDLAEFIKVEIKDLEEELECPACLEVAAGAPIYKCSDDHLICRWGGEIYLGNMDNLTMPRECRPKGCHPFKKVQFF